MNVDVTVDVDVTMDVNVDVTMDVNVDVTVDVDVIVDVDVTVNVNVDVTVNVNVDVNVIYVFRLIVVLRNFEYVAGLGEMLPKFYLNCNKFDVFALHLKFEYPSLLHIY